jgi:hypothetical protein
MLSIVMNLRNWLRYKLGKGKIQSFTFYIPSPPSRKFGYREKQFDKLFYEFINQGFEILQFSTQNNPNPEHSGMWIICLVKAKNHQAEKLNLEAFFGETIKNNSDNEMVVSILEPEFEMHDFENKA